jgi:transcriptional regulator GlxA family with amidase domain
MRSREQTGTTPLQWLLRARVRRAQVLLETTAQSIERIATSVRFGSASAFREHFRRVVAASPQGYRSAFRSRAAPRPGRRPGHGTRPARRAALSAS